MEEGKRKNESDISHGSRSPLSLPLPLFETQEMP